MGKSEMCRYNNYNYSNINLLLKFIWDKNSRWKFLRN